MAIATSFWLYDSILLILVAFSSLYFYFSTKFKFWENKNVPIPWRPTFFFGHFYGMQFTRTIADIIRDMYNATDKQRYFGAYIFGLPLFVVRDLDLVKHILVKDFRIFHDRGFFEVDIKENPLAGHLFMMKGQEWRNLRVKLTPTFTTGKMRMMFPTLKDVGKELVKVLENCCSESETDLKELLSRYTTDIISSCAFGIETNCLNNPDAEFRKYGDTLARPTVKQIVNNFVFMLAPWLGKLLNIRLFPDNVTEFYINVVRDTMQYRTENNVERSDFLQLLMQLKNLGYVPDVDNPVKNDESKTLRKYPVTGVIFRECNTDYSVPDSDVVLSKGQAVWLPLYGIHRDPEYYPDPDKFDPDRFLPEEKAKRNPYAYFPFGEGPRNCIGSRFALMQVKVGLVMVLSNFSITPSEKTPIPVVLDPKANAMQPKGKLFLNVNKREK